MWLDLKNQPGGRKDKNCKTEWNVPFRADRILFYD